MSTRSCAVCGHAATKVCSRCKTARYCSAACQRTGWRKHSKECASPEPRVQDIEDLAVESCACKKCQSLCLHVPGFFAPSQFLAPGCTDADLEDTLRERLGWLAVDVYRLTDEKHSVFMLRPATAVERVGPAQQKLIMPGTCRMLGATGCTLSLTDRPHECATARACRPANPSYHRGVAHKDWMHPDGMRVMEAFWRVSGREPVDIDDDDDAEKLIREYALHTRAAQAAQERLLG